MECFNQNPLIELSCYNPLSAVSVLSETGKYHPLQEGTVGKGECFQRIQLFRLTSRAIYSA